MAAEQEPTPPKVIWTEAVAAKRATRDEHIDKHHNKRQYSNSIVKVTEVDDIGTLQELFNSGEISTEAVVNAYIDK